MLTLIGKFMVAYAPTMFFCLGFALSRWSPDPHPFLPLGGMKFRYLFLVASIVPVLTGIIFAASKTDPNLDSLFSIAGIGTIIFAIGLIIWRKRQAHSAH